MEKELLKENKSEESKVCEVRRFQSKIFGWDVIERFDGLKVDRQDEVSKLELYLDGKMETADIDEFLQRGHFITASNDNTVWTFIRCNGSFLQIKPAARIEYEDDFFFEVYEYNKGVMVYFFNSEGKITRRKLFDFGYKKKGNWYFENETAVYRVVMKENPYRLSVMFHKHRPRKRWFWPFWKV